MLVVPGRLGRRAMAAHGRLGRRVMAARGRLVVFPLRLAMRQVVATALAFYSTYVLFAVQQVSSHWLRAV